MSPPNQTTSFDVAGNQCDDNGAACNPTNNNEQESQQRQRKQQMDWEGPPAQGLYDPINEHEACGVGFIVAIDGKRSHKVTTSSLLFFHHCSVISTICVASCDNSNTFDAGCAIFFFITM